MLALKQIVGESDCVILALAFCVSICCCTCALRLCFFLLFAPLSSPSISLALSLSFVFSLALRLAACELMLCKSSETLLNTIEREREREREANGKAVSTKPIVCVALVRGALVAQSSTCECQFSCAQCFRFGFCVCAPLASFKRSAIYQFAIFKTLLFSLHRNKIRNPQLKTAHAFLSTTI